jgi:hypothetical protein
MDKLPITLKRNGCKYTQLFRDERKAVYRQEVSETSIWYEVIKIKIEAGAEVFGIWIGEHERYPCTSDWGKMGWTFRSLKNAIKKYDAL